MKPRTFQTPAQTAAGDEPGELVTDRWLTTRDAAERLHVSLRTIQLWVEGGILPAARTPGGHRRIPESAVDALAAQTGLGGVLNPNQTSAKSAPPQATVDVLLVEDNADQRLLWERTLEAFGKRITLRTAENGYSGLIQIGRKKPDLLITDLVMPGIDGFEMIRTLAKSREFGSIRIIVVSALAAADIMDRGGLPEGVETLRKPISPSSLVEKVEQTWPALAGSTSGA